MVGAGSAILELTGDYAKQRIQFGKPIGQYQGVKHRLADMYVDLGNYRSLCYFAGWWMMIPPHTTCGVARQGHLGRL